MKLWNLLRTLSVSLFIVVTMQCFGTEPAQTSNRSSIGGTGSEITGVVNYPDSSNTVKKMLAGATRPMSFAGVFIHPKNYLADVSQTTELPYVVTDANGSFRISNVVPGEHLVYINDGSGMAIATRITVSQNLTPINLGTLISQKTASVQTQYQGTTPGNVQFYVSIEGTGLNVGCTSRNINVALNNIPTGPDIDHVVWIRMVKPFNKGRSFTVPDLSPGQLYPLQPFSDF